MTNWKSLIYCQFFCKTISQVNAKYSNVSYILVHEDIPDHQSNGFRSFHEDYSCCIVMFDTLEHVIKGWTYDRFGHKNILVLQNQLFTLSLMARNQFQKSALCLNSCGGQMDCERKKIHKTTNLIIKVHRKSL